MVCQTAILCILHTLLLLSIVMCSLFSGYDIDYNLFYYFKRINPLVNNSIIVYCLLRVRLHVRVCACDVCPVIN